MICMSGTPTIMPKVTRSRPSWRTSLTATARRRRNEVVNLSVATLQSLRRDHEYVLEAGLRARDGRLDAMLVQQGTQLCFGVALAAFGEHAQSQPELRDAAYPGQ